MNLLKYTIRRFLDSIPIFLCALIISFVFLREMTGSPYITSPESIGTTHPSGIYSSELSQRSIWYQFVFFFQSTLIKGQWGESGATAPGIPVWEVIWMKTPKSLEILSITTIISSYIGVRLGVRSAQFYKTIRASIIQILLYVMYATPIFLLAIVIRTLFTQVLPWFPTQGYIDVAYQDLFSRVRITGFGLVDTIITGNFFLWWDIVQHLFLPICVLVIGSMSGFTRYMRANMLQVLNLDYIRSARAKGCREEDILNKHALKNSMIPTVSLIGFNFGYLIIGTTLVEHTFNINGLGQLYLDAIEDQDFYLIQAIILLIIGLVLTANLLTDLIYGILDPRVRM